MPRKTKDGTPATSDARLLPSGYFDGCINDILYGWVWSAAEPAKHWTVEFVLDGVVIGSALCNRQRTDLKNYGFGNGDHGFGWGLAGKVKPSDVARVQARVAGLGAVLEGRAQPNYTSLAATGCYEGELYFGWPRVVAGEIVAASEPLPSWLELVVNGNLTFQLGLQRCPSSSGKRRAAAKFHWLVPPALAQVAAANVELRLPHGRLIVIGNVQARPIPADFTATAATTIEGRVESASVDRVSGWVCDPTHPDQPLDVAVKVDDEIVAVGKANRFAARLRNERRSGHHAFVLDIPPACFNGSNRRVTVDVLNAGVELPIPGGMLGFPLVAMPTLADETPPQTNNNYRPDWNSDYAKRVVSLQPAQRRARQSGVRVSLIMLNWNGEQLLQDFFASLQRHPPMLRYELLIVDHGSTDGSLALIRQQAKHVPVRLIARGDNYSYADSNNLAARSAKGELLLFLNNDLVLQHDCVSVMADVLDDARIGIVGARLLEPLREPGAQWTFAPHHEGVRFKVDALPDNGGAYYAPQELHDVPAELAGSVLRMPSVTAALMMCRKTDFVRTGGFSTAFLYGMEDVDFCLRLQHDTGKDIVVALQASAIHNRSATRDLKTTTKAAPKSYNTAAHLANRTAFIKRQGRALTGTILRSLLQGSSFYRRQPLRVVFAVTEAFATTAAGDFYTALELGKALQQQFGWQVLFVENNCQDVPGADVVVAMRHDYALRKLKHANPGVITVAWIRNRTDEWLAAPEFADYQLVLASSHKIMDEVRQRTGRAAVLLPIATNPERFSPARADAAHASDLVFTGNNHGVARGSLDLLAPDGKRYDFALYGQGWDSDKRYRRFHRGALRYDELAKAYASTKLVLDDGHPVTSDWHSLNSRVFDAIACGKVVLTNCVGGAQELFGNKLPSFTGAKELKEKITTLLADGRKRERLAQELRKHVLAHHTYAHRAATFKQSLEALLAPEVLRFAIKVPIPKEEEKLQWGDWHYAVGIKRALERKGHLVRIDLLPQWQAGIGAADDVVLVLRGLSRYQPQPTAINLLWLMSHPDAVGVEEMKQYDHVFVASASYPAKLAKALDGKVSTLLQCTDPAVFRPDTGTAVALPPVLFVGNSRNQRRAAIDNALACKADFAVFGTGWKDQVPAQALAGDYVANDELHRYYSSASVVLNDHWPDMRREGFLSNRLFDAGASGAVLFTDKAAGLREVFGDSVITWDTPASFKRQLDRLLGDAALRKKLSVEVRKRVLAKHTFDHRIAELLGRLEKLRT